MMTGRSTPAQFTARQRVSGEFISESFFATIHLSPLYLTGGIAHLREDDEHRGDALHALRAPKFGE